MFRRASIPTMCSRALFPQVRHCLAFSGPSAPVDGGNEAIGAEELLRDKDSVHALVPAFASALVASTATVQERFLHNRSYSEKPWEPSCVESDGGSLTFYFEMSTPQGKRGYQTIATQVVGGELPGTVKNFQVAGFATWTVPQQEYLEMVAQKPQLDE